MLCSGLCESCLCSVSLFSNQTQTRLDEVNYFTSAGHFIANVIVMKSYFCSVVLAKDGHY